MLQVLEHFTEGLHLGNISSFNGAYACNLNLGNFLVHRANLVCLHCVRSKVDHLHSFLSDIVSLILTDENVQQLAKNMGWKESFSRAQSLSTLADTYLDHFRSALMDWKSSCVNGDAVTFLNRRSRYYDSTEGCKDELRARLADCLYRISN